MRLLACLIVAPQRDYDEPAILSYAISSFCPTSADGLQDVLLVLLNPPQDFTSCRAGARPGHPITRREQSQQIASLFDHLISAGEERSRYSDTEDHAPPDRSRARLV